MITMDDSIYDIYRQGMIDKETAITFSQDQASMIKKLG
jgi:Tfp pilus assembly pilus retraction ATPase PilT